MKLRFGLRFQILAVSAVLLLMPLAGYFQVRNFAAQLLAGQRNALESRARQVAAALQQSSAGQLNQMLAPATHGDPARDLYAYPLSGPMQIDGRDPDWRPWLGHLREYGSNDIIDVYQHYTQASLHFYLIVGHRKGFLYLFLKVIDNRVVYRKVGSLSVHRNDYVQLAIVDPSGNYNRYTIAPMQPGMTHPFLVTSVEDGSRAIRVEPNIDAMWLATEAGYNVEVRIPLSMVSNRIAITVTDVDDPQSRLPIATIGTASTSDPSRIGSLLLPSPALNETLSALDIRHARIRIVDSERRLVAQSGNIAFADGPWHDVTATAEPQGWFSRVLHSRQRSSGANIVDTSADPGHVAGGDISTALAGQPGFAIRATSDGRATLLSAAVPLSASGHITGAAVVDETTAALNALVDRTMLHVVGTNLLIALLGMVGLLLYAVILSGRVRRINTNLDTATDPQGRVREQLPASTAPDELGELARNISAITARLRQYNQYLEDMARQLSHELRTPVSVIRSSLDNLSLHTGHADAQASVYVERAQEGVQRLATILTNMTEATRLEETMSSADLEYFDLAEVVSGCVKGYELAYPNKTFELSIEDEFDKLNGLPDLIAQMLDKLVNNAVEFARPGTPIGIRLTNEREAVLRVINAGPSLPGEMQDRLFDSMISVRRAEQKTGSHLGLGLYIARIIAEFHGGTIAARNREDTEGVIVTVRLPIMRITATPRNEVH